MVAAWRNLFKHNFGVNFHFYLSACECFTGLQISTREKNRTLDSPGHTVLYFVCLVLINYRHFPFSKVPICFFEISVQCLYIYPTFLAWHSQTEFFYFLRLFCFHFQLSLASCASETDGSRP